ncbi:G-type lectin S-receptor-like serine/threonine-protein kinase isoform X2 [Tanacetum coccineum]
MNHQGVLEEGLEIAVNCLSKSSSQGVDKFKNEVIRISKLQHRNLVKLLGCCIQGDDKLLIYEYMPNGSLNSFIFGKNQNISYILQHLAASSGYMSPEYALDGVFSIKSSVFSFGILVLDIVSGKRNRGFIQSKSKNNLIGYAWNLYNEGRLMELTDANLAQSCNPPETAILSGFASLNDHVDKRMAELNQHAKKTDTVLARIGEEAL